MLRSVVHFPPIVPWLQQCHLLLLRCSCHPRTFHMIHGWLCPSYRLWIWGTVVVQVCCPEVLPCSVPYCSVPFCSIQLFCSVVLFCSILPFTLNFFPDSQFLWWFLNLPLNQGALIYFKNCIKCSAYYGLTLLPWRIEKSVCGTSHQVLIFKIFTLFHSADLPSNFIQHSKEHLHRPAIRFKKNFFSIQRQNGFSS